MDFIFIQSKQLEKQHFFRDFRDYCLCLSRTDQWLCFLRYDEEHSADDKVFLDCFCKIAAGIKNNSNGHQLKDLILQKGITQSALDYMKKHIPNAKK